MKWKLYLRCCIYNELALAIFGLILIVIVLFLKGLHTANVRLMIIMPIYEIAFGVLIRFSAGETFKTYRQLAKISQENEAKALREARKIASSDFAQYCNKRGARLFIKDKCYS